MAQPVAPTSDVVSAIREGDILKLTDLVESGHSLNLLDVSSGLFPLHEAVDYENVNCVEYILTKENVDINQKANDGRTALHLAAACSNNAAELCNLLIERGADPHAKENSGALPLHLACVRGSPDVIGILLDADSVHAKNAKHFLPASFAAMCNNVEVLGTLFDFEDRNNKQMSSSDANSVAYVAAMTGSLDALKMIFQKYKESIMQDPKRCDAVLNSSISGGHLACIVFLLGEGVPIFTQSANGHVTCRALITAIFHRKESAFDLLLHYVSEPDIDRLNESVRTVGFRFDDHPLMMPLRFRQCDQFLQLLDVGFDPQNILWGMGYEGDPERAVTIACELPYRETNLPHYSRCNLICHALIEIEDDAVLETIIVALLDRGVNVNVAAVDIAPGVVEMPPLVAAALRCGRSGFEPNSPLRRIFALLLKRGADPKYRTPATDYKCADLVVAAACLGNTALLLHVYSLTGFNPNELLLDLSRFRYVAPERDFTATKRCQMRLRIIQSLSLLLSLAPCDSHIPSALRNTDIAFHVNMTPETESVITFDNLVTTATCSDTLKHRCRAKILSVLLGCDCQRGLDDASRLGLPKSMEHFVKLGID